MRSFLTRAFQGLVWSIGTAVAVAAPIENGRFEAGNFASWTVVGPQAFYPQGSYAAVVPAFDVFKPLQGDYSALLIARGSEPLSQFSCQEDSWNVQCPIPIPFASAPFGGAPLTFSGSFPAFGAIGGVIGQDFVAKAGDVLTWQWQFLGFDPDDALLVVLSNGDIRLTLVLGGGGIGTYSEFYPDHRRTESVTFAASWPRSDSLSIPASGLWTVYFGVVQQADSLYSGGILLDGVRVRHGKSDPSDTVP